MDYFFVRLLPSVQFTAAAVPSMLGVGEALGVAGLLSYGDGLAAVAVTLPVFQSVPTSKTIGETSELSKVSLVIPVWAARTFAASS